jgi:phosphatidylglycerol:prolipoprotein diacylglycerol transferase
VKLRPILFSLRLGSHEVGLHTYGVLIALGIAAGIALAYREGRRQGLDGGRLLDLAFWLTVAGLLGSRLAYGLVNLGDFARACVGSDQPLGAEPRSLGAWLSDCTRILHVWEGGLVFYGGGIGAAVVAALFARRERWSFWRVGDVFAPALALGHALGRLGCFAAGCCFGKAAAVPWAVSFPAGSVAFDEMLSQGAIAPGAALTSPLHPTQLYEAAGELLIFGLLLALRPRVRDRAGALFLAYVALYAPLRFVVEVFRGDAARLYVVPLTTPRLAAWLGLPAAEPALLSLGQVMSVVILVVAAIAFVRRLRAWRAVPGPAR